MRKYTVEEVLQSFIKRTNKELEDANSDYMYSYKFGKFDKEIALYNTEEQRVALVKADRPTTTKMFRTLRIYSHNMETGERIVVYENNYHSTDQRDFLAKRYKDVLVYEFIRDCFSKVCMAQTRLNEAGLDTSSDKDSDNEPSQALASPFPL